MSSYQYKAEILFGLSDQGQNHVTSELWLLNEDEYTRIYAYMYLRLAHKHTWINIDFQGKLRRHTLLHSYKS